MRCLYLEPVNGLPLFTEVPRGRVLRSTHGPGPMLPIPTDALWALLEWALRRGYGCRRIWHVPRAIADKPPNAVPASAGRRPGRAEMLANGSPPYPWRPRASERRSWSV